MHTISAKDTKYGFARLIDTARAVPITLEKHGRPAVIVVGKYQRLIGTTVPPSRDKNDETNGD